ncbi:MAG: tRNA (adenosine(37)-N6)-threonylcarbamoyltransferase complex ATPase subunit type 1 TsaE [Paracoccaceae bacterium]|nr:tRNA (adenosine(37)-N6)-threonylcarbamoyltransferase complex ATPase subunit type 1 TsaE [Paracoccaceae bacterium]
MAPGGLTGATANLPTEAATRDLAGRFAACLAAGDVVLLAGPLGAGKSAFCRELIQSRQAMDGLPAEDVPSPTFTLVQTYATGNCELWHADLYRIKNDAELPELGLEDAVRDAICLVEWPEILNPEMTTGALVLRFEITGDTSRQVAMEWRDPRWEGVVRQVLGSNGAMPSPGTVAAP